MFDLTILDYIYIGIILLSTILATVRGGIYETVATMSWVVAAVTARFVSPYLDNLLQGWFDLSESTVGTLVASYFIVFFTVLMLIGFINQKLRNKIQESIMNITDHALGVIFGIIRGVAVMGFIYMGILWYYSDIPSMPDGIVGARTRPLMQLTAEKMDQWFVPGPESKLLRRDIISTREAKEIYNNLINPAVAKSEKTKDVSPKAESKQPAVVKPTPQNEEVGYKATERTALENQLLQIKTVADAIEERESKRESE